MNNLLHNYKLLYNNLLNEDFVIDKSGVKVVELIAPKINIDPNCEIIDIGIRKTNINYLLQEKDWYLSNNLSIKKVQNVKIWRDCSDIHNEINSNYGYLVFGRGNFNQFDHCLNTLINHKESRQAIIIYNRPSIHYESQSFECKDFICTMYQQFFIRKNMLNCVTSMRSNDCIFGTLNDLPWFNFVIRQMYFKLINTYSELKLGEHIFIPNSWHCYERHFDVLRQIGENCG